MPHSKTAHVLEYLEWAKSQESDPWAQDDLHISWLTVLYASRDLPQPTVRATQVTLGLHPDHVWPAIEERRRAKLGPLYDQIFPASTDADLPPKKSAQPAVRPTRRVARG